MGLDNNMGVDVDSGFVVGVVVVNGVDVGEGEGGG